MTYVTENEKKIILSDLLISGDIKKEEFKTIVSKSKELFGIGGITGCIEFYNDYSVSNKILLFLIGKHFAKLLNIIQSDRFTLSDISDGIYVKITSITKPLTSLTKENIICKEKENYFLYSIRDYKINEIIDKIYSKIK